MSTINLVWCHSALAEEHWLSLLLSGLEIRQIVAPNFDTVLDNSIYVVSCNGDLAHAAPPSFFERLRRTSGKGLIHLSDERFGGGYHIYAEFDFVIRNYWSRKFDRPGILTIPLGFASAGQAGAALPASQRAYLWTFLGNANGARAAMMRRFKRIEPRFLHTYDSRTAGRSGKLAPERYAEIMSNTVFCPCPIGNVNMETFRVYEALEAGCIPLVERRATLRYFDLLMPSNPIPSFSSWAQARQFIQEIRKHPEELDRLQQLVGRWWNEYKSSLQSVVREFCFKGLSGEFQSAMRRNWPYRSRFFDQLWRVVELSRHHSLAAARDRARIISSATVRRILGSNWRYEGRRG